MGQELDVIAFVFEGRHEHGEVDRRHGRRQDDVLFGVFFGEDRLFVGIRFEGVIFFRPMIHDEEERAQADADSTEVRAFVDLEQGVDLVAVGQDILYLIGDDGVEAAAEGIEFYQF